MNINYLSYYIPDSKVSIDKVIGCYTESELPNDFKDKQELTFFFQRFIGLKCIHVAESLDEVELIDKAFEKIDEKPKSLLPDIKLIMRISS